jgi:hypothetical protein
MLSTRALFQQGDSKWPLKNEFKDSRLEASWTVKYSAASANTNTQFSCEKAIIRRVLKP